MYTEILSLRCKPVKAGVTNEVDNHKCLRKLRHTHFQELEQEIVVVRPAASTKLWWEAWFSVMLYWVAGLILRPLKPLNMNALHSFKMLGTMNPATQCHIPKQKPLKKKKL